MIDEGARRTRLERARRHVEEGEGRVAAQYERVRKLRATGADTHQAEALLRSFRRTLQIMREGLATQELRHETAKTLVVSASDEGPPPDKNVPA